MALDPIDVADDVPGFCEPQAPVNPVATDNIANVFYQIVKLDIGGIGSNIALSGGQKPAASSVPVVLASDQPPIDAAPPANTILDYTEVTGIAASTVTTIATFTAVATTRVTKLILSGTDYAKVTVRINSTVQATKRMGPDRNVEFDLNLELSATDTVDIRAEHFHTGDTNDYEGLILGYT